MIMGSRNNNIVNWIFLQTLPELYFVFQGPHSFFSWWAYFGAKERYRKSFMSKISDFGKILKAKMPCFFLWKSLTCHTITFPSPSTVSPPSSPWAISRRFACWQSADPFSVSSSFSCSRDSVRQGFLQLCKLLSFQLASVIIDGKDKVLVPSCLPFYPKRPCWACAFQPMVNRIFQMLVENHFCR